MLFFCVALAAPPAALSGPLLDAAAGVSSYFSPTPLDNAGNSTGILLTSALASLAGFRRGGSTGAIIVVALLGIAAGIGA